MIQQFRSWVDIKENENSNSKWYLHLKVHSSIIYNSQDMEATEVSIDRATVKMYKGMPLAIKKKNDILPFSTTRMNLEGIMLSEIIRERKTNTIEQQQQQTAQPV